MQPYAGLQCVRHQCARPKYSQSLHPACKHVVRGLRSTLIQFCFLQAKEHEVEELCTQLSAAREGNARLKMQLQQRQTEWKAASLQAAEVSSAESYLMQWFSLSWQAAYTASMHGITTFCINAWFVTFCIGAWAHSILHQHMESQHSASTHAIPATCINA